MAITVQHVREIVDETALKEGLPSTFDEAELASDLQMLGLQFRFHKRFEREWTSYEIRSASLELAKRANALIDALAGFPEGSIQLYCLDKAANEWAARTGQPFTNLDTKQDPVSEVSGHEVVDLGAESVDQFRLQLARFVEIANLLSDPERKSPPWLTNSPRRRQIETLEDIFKPISPEVQLIGGDLPSLYSKHFRLKFGTSVIQDRSDGPGIRFVRAALNCLGVASPEGGKPYANATIRSYWRQFKKMEITG